MAMVLPLILSLTILSLVVDGRNQNLLEMQHSFTGSQDLNSILPTIQNDLDCVDIYKQPAFQHPSLKSHKIQLHPTFSRKTMQRESSYSDNVKVYNLIKGCPPGKVPVPKNIKLMHQKNITSESHVEDFRQFSQSYPGRHFATLDTTPNTTYRGAVASISAYNLSLQLNQYSLSQIWIQGGPPAELNSIQVGLGVHPSLYGDSRLRVTGYWTADNFRTTGCFNTQCPGFVQVHRNLTFGGSFNDSSTIGGTDKYYLSIKIKQDQLTGNWWFIVSHHGEDENIGYWPGRIFTHLKEGSSLIRYGGETFAPSSMDSPPMGSGNLPQTSFRYSAFIAMLQIVDSEYNEVDVNPKDMKPYCDTTSSCYDVLYHGYEGTFYRQALLFGGPGGQCGT